MWRRIMKAAMFEVLLTNNANPFLTFLFGGRLFLLLTPGM